MILVILKSVRIRKFKCIEDSTEFSLGPVTCLVGKNESGKSAILEALYKLNPLEQQNSRFDEVEEYPRFQLSDYQDMVKKDKANTFDQVLTTTWELTDEDRQAIREQLGIDPLSSSKVILEKGYSNTLRWHIEIEEADLVKSYVDQAGLYKEEADSLDGVTRVGDLVAALKSVSEPSERQKALLANLNAAFPQADAVKAITDILVKRLPRFLYFSDYYRMSGQVALSQLTTNKASISQKDRVFLALLGLAGTTPEEFVAIGKYEPFAAKLEAASNKITREIFSYWSQNAHLDVDFRCDSGMAQDPPPFNSGLIFRTRIKNRRHGSTVSFDERSSGFVWFFSFLVWFSQAKNNYGENLIILLDEPGLSLHAKAQGDLLRYIREKLQPYYQVVYTTHSPFMIDPDHLVDVRTVEDLVVEGESLGTKVGDQVLSTDVDTVFPLQAALGYDITQTLFVGKHTLLVEGPGDLLYLKWFSRVLESRKKTGLDARWTVCPCGGIDKVGSFVALFGGNKLDIAVLTDFHHGDKKKVRGLKESTLLKSGHVLTADMYIDQDEADVEDLIGRPFYVGLVNRCWGLDAKTCLPAVKPEKAPARVLKEVEDHFAQLPPSVAAFDHYTLATFLVENGAALQKELPGLDEALDRFERVFKDLNSLLPN